MEREMESIRGALRPATTAERRRLTGPLVAIALVVWLAAPASAQDRRAVIFGSVGGASIGHADSEQGKAPIAGGGVGFHLTPRLVVEGDVHAARVSHVFGRENHDFSEVTFTGSLLYRAPVSGRVHVVAGGGLGLQRAHTDVDEPPFFRIDQVETLRLLHGRLGAEWDISSRLVIRTDFVLWMGEGLDWVAGGRAGVGYRF
jgi:hypothetical protein